MRALLLSAALLFTGCATHTHVSDCAACLGAIVVHDRVADQEQTREIYKAVGEALKATPAPVTSKAATK